MYNLCLNMIVKNESHTIQKTLTNLLIKIPQIDYYVISDTGSTDSTVDIIRSFFNSKKIKGEIYHDEWKDFGYNRTRALEYAYQKSLFLLIFDADDEIIGDIQLPDLRDMRVDAYYLQFGPSIKYVRTQLIQNLIEWQYKGVLHEYICLKKEKPLNIQTVEGNYFIISGKHGARSQDPNKYKNDASLLEKAYQTAVESNDSLKHRYCFYCAQSYFDANDKLKALEWYKKVLTHECWTQEKYYACLRIYYLLRDLNKEEEGIFYLIKSICYDIQRYDCIYELIRYYCGNGMNIIAWNFYQLIQTDYESNYLIRSNCSADKLFVNEWYGSFVLPYYMIITSINIQNYETALKMYEIIFTKKFPERNEFYISHLLMNIGCLFTHLKDKISFQTQLVNYISFLKSIQYPIEKHSSVYQPYINIFKEPKFSKEICRESSKLLIYAGYAPNDWNYSYYQQNALGGSETACMLLALHLSVKYEIYIIGSVKEETIKDGRIQFIHHQNASSIIEFNSFQSIIVSRYLDFLHKYNYSTNQLIVWAHDTQFHDEHFVDLYHSKIDICICLTNWHKELFDQKYPLLKAKTKIIPNGIIPTIPIIDYSSFKIKDRFIYSSCVERGLQKVLECWPSILTHKPNAQLFICTYNAFPLNPEQIKMKEKIDEYSSSIFFLGKLNKNELYDLMKTCEYWFYPTNWLETSCITALEMMYYGVLCCYYPLAGLKDTIGESNGIILPYNKEVDTIVQLSLNDKSRIIKNAQEYVQSFYWNNIQHQWFDLLEKKPFYLILIPSHYYFPNFEDYLEGLKTKYDLIYTQDMKMAKKYRPSKVFFLNELFDTEIYNFFKTLSIEINILNTEPLNIKCRLNRILTDSTKIHSIYDYSKSNINILTQRQMTSLIHFPYIVSPYELEYLMKLKKNTKIEYQFGILISLNYIERRHKVIDFLQLKGFSVNVICNQWKEKRDIELAKCKYILNIHGFFEEITMIFEHIRCDRLLKTGFSIISEECIDYCENQYPNLHFIPYIDFFNTEKIQSFLTS